MLDIKAIRDYIKDAATQVRLTPAEVGHIKEYSKKDFYGDLDMEDLYQDLKIDDERYVNVTIHPELDEKGRVVLTTLVNVYHEDGETDEDYDLQDQLQEWANKYAEKQYFE